MRPRLMPWVERTPRAIKKINRPSTTEEPIQAKPCHGPLPRCGYLSTGYAEPTMTKVEGNGEGMFEEWNGRGVSKGERGLFAAKLARRLELGRTGSTYEGVPGR